MTISTETIVAGPFTGNGVTEVFAFAFKVFTDADVLVKHTTTGGIDSTAVLNTDYTVARNVDQDNNPGGTIQWKVAGVNGPLPTGEKVTITSQVANTQGTALPSGGSYAAKTVERMIDKVTILVKQVLRSLQRSLVVPITDGITLNELPNVANRANKVLAFDASGQPVAQANVPVSAVAATAFAETLLDDATADAVIETLADGATAETAFALGDKFLFSDISANSGRVGTLQNLFNAVNVLTAEAAPAAGDKLPLYDASGNQTDSITLEVLLKQILDIAPLARPGDIINGEIVESHVANAVTYTLKGKGGVDLSATNPCYLLFPKATLTDAGFDPVKVTSNISVTLSSGSTIGHASAIAQHTFIGALITGGAAELFATNLPPEYPGTFLGQRLISTTAEGGAGAADSATGIYSTTARSNVAWISLAKVKGTQTVAGTWAASPTQIDMSPFDIQLCAISVHRNSVDQSINNSTVTKIQYTTEEFDTDAVFDNATNYRFQPNVAGYYRATNLIYLKAVADGKLLYAEIHKNGALAFRDLRHTGNGTDIGNHVDALVLMNGTTDYLEAYIQHTDTVARDLSGVSTQSRFSASRVTA